MIQKLSSKTRNSRLENTFPKQIRQAHACQDRQNNMLKYREGEAFTTDALKLGDYNTLRLYLKKVI